MIIIEKAPIANDVHRKISLISEQINYEHSIVTLNYRDALFKNDVQIAVTKHGIIQLKAVEFDDYMLMSIAQRDAKKIELIEALP